MSLIDRRLLDIRLTVQKIANSPDDNPTAGIQYIVGTEATGAFEGAAANSIATFDGYNWKFIAPSVLSLEVFNLDTKELLRYNGSAWVAVVTVPDVDSLDFNNSVTEKHTLTEEEITAKSFTLENSVKSGQENNVLLFISGVAQVVGSDFTVSDNSVSWENKGLDNISLLKDDIVLVHYIKA